MDLTNVSSFEQLDALLADGKISEEQYNDLWNALKGSGAAPDADSSKDKSRKCPLSAREITVVVTCAFIQVMSLITTIAGIPFLPGVSGFAAIILYILTPREWRFVRKITLIGAICGACEIVFTIVTTA